jgi:hypothetical protein
VVEKPICLKRYFFSVNAVSVGSLSSKIFKVKRVFGLS